MSNITGFLDVVILGREYRVACAPEEREALEAAVRLVDEKMREAGKARNTTPERAAVMAALNIAHEFLIAEKSGRAGFDSIAVKRRMETMDARLDGILALPDFTLE
ncbi:MAG: cell division protein ZapA [Zoogloeaceae bacterium]|jgi:cell division protein ZapA|nr:cell division protein ZapA [Zoogloeaceae bacterium]